MLAYNKLSGSVPQSIQLKGFVDLDLSYNKLSGKYTDATMSLDNTSRSLGSMKLQVNRLSGRFPSTSEIAGIGTLNALKGNLFGCGNIPEGDEYSSQYSCGSQDLDLSLKICLSVVGFLFIFVLVLYVVGDNNRFLDNSLFYHFLDILQNFRKYSSLFEYKDTEMSRSVNQQVFSRIRRFGIELIWVNKLFTFLVCILFMTSVPLYGMKIFEYGLGETDFTTHSYQYRWVLTVAYMRGEWPLVLLLVMWVSVVIGLILLTVPTNPLRSFLSRSFTLSASHGARLSTENSIASRGDVPLVSNEEENSREIESTSIWQKGRIIPILFLNTTVVGCVCGIYIYFSSRTLPAATILGLQFLMAIFNFSWNIVVVPILSRPMLGVKNVVWSELWLLLFNNIFLPSIVTAFTSPACFQVIMEVLFY